MKSLLLPVARRLLRPAVPTVLALLLGAGCHQGPPPETRDAAGLPPVEVEVGQAAPEQVTDREWVPGSVRARRRATLEAKVAGRILRLEADPGRTVREGDVLAELDAAEMQARLDQAQAALQQADRDLARVRALVAQEAVTRADLEAAESRQRIAAALLRESETMVGYTRITAPFNGVVTRRLADAGSFTGPGRAIVEVEDPTSLRFEADVPVSLLDQVRLGDSLHVQLSGLRELVRGPVSEVDPSADPASRTFRVRVDLPAEPPARAGWFGRLELPLGRREVVTVPTRAILRRGQLELAFVVTNAHAVLRLVRTGPATAGGIEVLAGLDPGETVVVGDLRRLADGQPVRVR